MAASVYRSSSTHHNRNMHNSIGLSSSHNNVMSKISSDVMSQVHSSFYNNPLHYLQHNNNLSSLKNSTAFSSIIVSPSHNEIPPKLPKKLKKNYHTSIVGDTRFYAESYLVRNKSRKSAVELLAESKPYYVRSENVLDKTQLYCQNMRACGPRMKSTSTTLASKNCLISPSHTFHPKTSLNYQKSASTNSELLQIKLRGLNNSATSSAYDSSTFTPHKKIRLPNTSSDHVQFDPPEQFSSSNRINREVSAHPISDVDSDVMFPSAFLSPQSLPSNRTTFDDTYCDYKSFSILNDYQPISPPAEYAEFNESSIQYSARRNPDRYVTAEEEEDYLSTAHYKNNHKSLPDLHLRMQNNRISPYSDYSDGRGSRSFKSNSSLNRDSGGSSGNYTPHCERYYKHEINETQTKTQKKYPNIPQKNYEPNNRRDSGSSTQHSDELVCIECDDQNIIDSNYFLNFTTCVVPEAFQDHFSESENDDQSKHKNYAQVSSDHMHSTEGELSPPLGTFRRQKCLRLKQHPSRHPSPSEFSTTANGFGDRKPILRSKSDISHRYSRKNNPTADSDFIDDNCAMSEHHRAKSENFSELEQFFDRLGLSEDLFNSSDSNRSSPVFFSDIATIDSDQLPDSTETQFDTQPYRPIEPTSIVERNARIIKWLCTCRKMQLN